MYTLRQALHFLYPRVSQYGASKAIGSQSSYIFAANDCIDYIYSYGWYKRSWLSYREPFVVTWSSILYLKTTYWISSINNFYTSQFASIHSWWSCNCACDDPCSVILTPACNKCICSWDCMPISLTEKMPHEDLCPGSYRIESSSITWMWWLDGNVIAIMLPSWMNISNLWVSYIRTPTHIRSYDDILFMPDRYMGIFWLLMAELIAPHYWQFMQWAENQYKQKADERLQHMKMLDSHVPDWVSINTWKEATWSMSNTVKWQLYSNKNIM